MEHDLKNKLYALANKVFGISFDAYLVERGDRQLWGLTIEKDISRHSRIFGDPDPRFLAAANDHFQRAGERMISEAGYRVDVGNVPMFKSLHLNADILLINLERLSDDPLDLDALLIHELCHMVIDSNIVETSLLITKEDRYHGSKLYKKTDVEYEPITRHTLQFCEVLASAAVKAATELGGYKDRWDVIYRAMRHGDMEG